MADHQRISAIAARMKHMRPLIGGMLALAVAMGIGRFAYTPILPVMQEELHLSVSLTGFLASVNYTGYLIGAFVAGLLPFRSGKSRLRTARFALVGSVVTTGAMGISSLHGYWLFLRGIGGFFSALIMVLTSSLIMDWLSRKRESSKAGFVYAGIGLGIVLSGSLIPWFVHMGGWQTGWYGLGGISLLLCAFSVRFLTGMEVPEANNAEHKEEPPIQAQKPAFRLWGITVAYGLEGLGYIVMATFVTAFFKNLSSYSWLGDISWILVGLAGIPSTWLWTRAVQKWGWQMATYAAYMCQAIGVLLPAIYPAVISALIASILFGGTFMGITALALSIGRQCAPVQSNRVIGNMTALFGVGQVIGPIGAVAITNAMHSYNMAMLASGALLLLSVCILWISRTRS